MTDQSWVYVQSEPGLWTVGFYAPNGKWHSDSDHVERNEAASRCAWLNGSTKRLPSDVMMLKGEFPND